MKSAVNVRARCVTVTFFYLKAMILDGTLYAFALPTLYAFLLSETSDRPRVLYGLNALVFFMVEWSCLEN